MVSGRDFMEFDALYIRKAQACGWVPVTRNVGALAESVQFGVKIPCKQPDPPVQPGRFYYGAEDPETQRLWIEATVDLLSNPEKRTEFGMQGANWARQFAAPQNAARWHALFRT